MARGKDSDLRLKGLGLGARFALTMTLALAVVMAVAGFILVATLSSVAENVQHRHLLEAVRVNAEKPIHEPLSDTLRHDHETGVDRAEVRFGDGLDQRGVLYLLREENEDGVIETRYRFLMPSLGLNLDVQVVKLLVPILVLVLLVATGVAFWISGQVTRPIHKIVTVVRQMAKGDLAHRVRVKGGGEIELLARAIDRMGGDLEAARESELELSIREREMQVAAEVRGALLPMGMPIVEGFDIESGHFASEHPGGDWHDYIELPDGGVGLLVAEVSGQGVPAAVVGATARAYLRTALSRGGDPARAFADVNAALGHDVRKGMFVTALYAALRPNERSVDVVCAGHKMPLVRFSRSGGDVRSMHPGGIALGLDKGPVFERALEVQTLEVQPGERLVLSTTGPISIADKEGKELGEKRFYSVLLKAANADSGKFVPSVRRVLERFSADGAFPVDVSIVAIECTS